MRLGLTRDACARAPRCTCASRACRWVGRWVGRWLWRAWAWRGDCCCARGSRGCNVARARREPEGQRRARSPAGEQRAPLGGAGGLLVLGGQLGPQQGLERVRPAALARRRELQPVHEDGLQRHRAQQPARLRGARGVRPAAAALVLLEQLLALLLELLLVLRRARAGAQVTCSWIAAGLARNQRSSEGAPLLGRERRLGGAHLRTRPWRVVSIVSRPEQPECHHHPTVGAAISVRTIDETPAVPRRRGNWSGQEIARTGLPPCARGEQVPTPHVVTALPPRAPRDGRGRRPGCGERP